MKNVFKVIYALIAIALVYVLYLVALGNRYEIRQVGDRVTRIYDKWDKQVVLVYYDNRPYEWQDWGEMPKK